ncbi:MAG: ABC transporter permease [Myxococcota bacterium]|nr:ABC transporter permease [Myxococcota bacterium]
MTRKIAIGVLAAWLVVAALADVIARDDGLVRWAPETVDKNVTPASPPDSSHWLGTDTARRDVLARLVHGARLAFAVGFGAATIMIVIGVAIGLAAGYGPPALDRLLTRLTDAVLALPIFFVALAVMGVVAQPGTLLVIVIIGGSAWPPLARLIRAETKRLKTLDFVRAAEAMGASSLYVARRHVLPHLVPLVAVAFAFGVATAALVEASLSFLGFGVPDAVASWGGLMRGAAQHLEAWWLILGPGLALLSLTIACNVLGEVASARDSRLLSDRAGP